MGMFVAFGIGYLFGARAGSKDFDRIVESARAVAKSEEFGDLMAAARTHASHTLREVASMLEGGRALTVADLDTDGDLVNRVRGLFAHDAR